MTNDNSSSNDQNQNPKIPKALEVTGIVLLSVVIAILLVYVMFFHGKDVHQLYGKLYDPYIKRTRTTQGTQK